MEVSAAVTGGRPIRAVRLANILMAVARSVGASESATVTQSIVIVDLLLSLW